MMGPLAKDWVTCDEAVLLSHVITCRQGCFAKHSRRMHAHGSPAACAGIPYELLNAKPENVERESEIVAQSGRRGAVTIATNMAGRGTDILLGGNPEYMARVRARK